MAKSKFLSEFRTFLERGSAIDMAVGIIVGSVMTTMVNSLVKDVIMPPIGMLVGFLSFCLVGNRARTITPWPRPKPRAQRP